MKKLNNRFDTDKPILEAMADEAARYGGELSDDAFNQALSEFNANEDDLMFEMLRSEKYKIDRIHNGFSFEER